jgi:KUP system potassium uptake protein
MSTKAWPAEPTMARAVEDVQDEASALAVLERLRGKPEVSVLSAVEGAGLKVPAIEPLAIEIALIILTALFLGQRFGTEKVGRLFGPVMLVWFIVIAAMGINGIRQNPVVLEAILPIYAFEFVIAHPLLSFGALSAVTLAITGAEALYADMGHFGRSPITLSWAFFSALACASCSSSLSSSWLR